MKHLELTKNMEGMEWIVLAQVRVRWPAVVNAVMKCPVP
jgi:hypothetical protein